MLNRRAFLAAIAAAAVDPERLLWVPGKRRIFIPKGLVSPDKFVVDERIHVIWLDKTDKWAAFLKDYGTLTPQPMRFRR